MLGTQIGNALRALASRRDVVSDESGQILIFGVVLLTVMLVIGAVVMDAGMAFSEKDGVQTATDAAALAGAQSLGTSKAAAQTAACDYLNRNGYSSPCVFDTFPCPSSDNCVNIPPKQSPPTGVTYNNSFVEVIGNSSSGAGFINIFAAVGALKPSARSVATYTAGGSVSAGVYAYVTNPPTGPTCQPAKYNFPAHNVEFSGGTTTIVGNLRSNGSIYAAGLSLSGGQITFGCQIGPINSCHPVCDPAIQDTNQGNYPPPIPLSGSAGNFYSTALRNVCTPPYSANVYAMSSGNPITTAHDQNNVVRYHAPRLNTSERGTFDPGIYCVNGPIVIPNGSCIKPSTSADVHACYVPSPAGSLPAAGEGATFIAMGTNGYIQQGQGPACPGGCSILPLFSSSSLNPLNVLLYAEATGGAENGSAIHPGCGTSPPAAPNNRYLYTGIVAAPNGQVNGGGLCTFWGAWIGGNTAGPTARAINITGGGIIINASGIGGVGGSPVVALVE